MKNCKKGYYYCYTDKKCKRIPLGFKTVGPAGYLRKETGHTQDDDSENGKKNGKKNGSNGGNGNSNGSNGNGGNGSGSSGGVSEAYYGGEEQRKKDEKKKKINAFMDKAMPKRTFDQFGRETDRRTGKLK